MPTVSSCLVDPEHECYGLLEAQKVREEMKELEDDIAELRRQNSSTHERIFDKLHDVDKFGAEQNIKFEHILEKLNQLSSDITEIKTKPAKRWENAVEQIIGIIIAAVVCFFLAKFGM